MDQCYWGLRRSPFSSAGREFLAQSPVHAEALARLEFLRDRGLELGLLLGPAGCGKSLTLAEFAMRSTRSGFMVSLIPAAAAGEADLYAELAIGLQAAVDGPCGQPWRRIVDRLCELKLEGLRAVVILDDLDRAAAGALAVVERLLALPDAGVSIVASCRPQSVRRIGSRLLQYAALRIDLVPWDADETRSYVQTRLARAGRDQPAFEDSATQRLFELSGGLPRRVNRLAELSLVAGAAQKLDQIDAETIAAVHEELGV